MHYARDFPKQHTHTLSNYHTTVPIFLTTVQSPEKMFKCNVSFPTFPLTHLKKFFVLSFAILFFPSVYRSRLTLTQCHSLASYTMKSLVYISLLKKLPLSQKKKKLSSFLENIYLSLLFLLCLTFLKISLYLLHLLSHNSPLPNSI